jgi:hypothetical protein
MRYVVLLTLALLTACGGGDPEEEDKAQISPPICKERPELCK